MQIIKLKEENNEEVPQNGALTITDIKPAAKNENRVNVFVNQKYDFSLDIVQVVDFKLKVGKVLSEEELEKLRQASEFGKLYQRALEKTLSRPHSVKEIRDYLIQKRQKRLAENKMAIANRKKEKELIKKYKLKTKEQLVFSDADIENIIVRLMERGYLDDVKFAEYFVENRNVKKGESLRKIQMELLKKGISADIIERVLQESGRNDEEELKKIIAKKAKKYDEPEKLINYLVRQGFDYQLVKDLILNQ